MSHHAEYHINFPHWPLARPLHSLRARERAVLNQFYAYHETHCTLGKVEVLPTIKDDPAHVPWRLLASIFGFKTKELKKRCGAEDDNTEARLANQRKHLRKIPGPDPEPTGVPRREKGNNWGIGPRTIEDVKLLKKLKREKAQLLAEQDKKIYN